MKKLKELLKDIPIRYKNIYFYMGIVAVFLASTGITPADLTSWAILWSKIEAVALNPYLVGCAFVAIVGVIINPTTKGLRDEAK